MNKVFAVSIDVSNDDIELDRYCRKEIEKIFDSKEKAELFITESYKECFEDPEYPGYCKIILINPNNREDRIAIDHFPTEQELSTYHISYIEDGDMTVTFYCSEYYVF